MMPVPWPFTEPPNRACFSTRKVLKGAPILLVSHDSDGDWQFLCGQIDGPEDIRTIGLDCALNLDATIGELADLPRGWQAWRDSPDDDWDKYPATSE